MLHQHQPAQASATQNTLHSSKSVRRKRLQHYIRQIKRLVAERLPPADPEEKLGTIDALDKTVELLRATPVCAPEAANPSLSPPHSWPDLPPENVTHINDDAWTPSVDFARRHIFSARVTLPDGRITDFQKVTTKEINGFKSLRCDTCFLDLVPPYGRQALLIGAYNNCIQKKRILTRITGSGAYELLCEYKRSGQGSAVSIHIHALELESAFGPSKTLNTFVFSTRHTSSCSLIHIDSSATYYIGYLPGEVINHSILYLLHPYDMAQIKQIHATLSMQRGEIVRQRRLRWIAFNGSIVHTNSEWFVFWNPWTHKVDSVIGRHTLNEHPIGNADVLAEPCAPRIVTPLDELTVRNIESEIAALLNKEPTLLIRDERYKAAPMAHQKNLISPELTSATHLGAYIDNLVETFVINAASSGNRYSTPAIDACRSPVNPTDLTSANCGNGSPLTYNQINCLENVHRLLKSQQRAPTVAAASTIIGQTPENGSQSKLSPCEDSKSPLPVPEQDDSNRSLVDAVGPTMPLTRELLQQHTQKWEQEYRDTWKKRLGLKRPMQQTEFVVPVSSKIFRDSGSSHRTMMTQSAPAGLSSSRSEYWPPTDKGEYYRSLGPNPPPPPGRNFQITSVPLPPPLPSEERWSAFVPLPAASSTATASSFSSIPKLPRDISQPINLSLNGHIQQIPGSDPERQQSSQQQPQHRSVIKAALLTTTQLHPQQQYPESGKLSAAAAPPQAPVAATTPAAAAAQRYLSSTSLDMTLEWCPGATEYGSTSTGEARETCAARLINLAQRAQQQQLEQKRMLSPLASSPVKEATDALMLLQETTSF